MISRYFNYMADNFGGKRAYLEYQLCQLLMVLGCHNRYRRVNFKEVERLVFVCMGNICRSPLGEYVAVSEGVNASSIGLHASSGTGADPRAIAFGNTIGVDLSQHKAREVTDETMTGNDLLVVMEPGQARELRKLVGAAPQITLLGLWHSRPHSYIHDPYSANEQYFNTCENAVTKAAKNLANHVKSAPAK